MPSKVSIEQFLAQEHIAVVGVSRSPKEFANAVATHLRSGGRTVYPVNAAADEIDGQPCFRSVADVPDPLDGVLVMVPPDAARTVVEDCVARGVPRVWLHKGSGAGAVSPEAVARCREAGIDVVDGACPMMFAEPVAFFHKAHRWFWKGHLAA
jgi:predicted CoA-binding protein